MKYSIIIPIFNEAKNIKLTIKRVSKILNQKKIVYEIIFVDDDSTDNSEKVYKNFKTSKTKFFLRKDKPRDLSRSVVFGFKKAKFNNLAVMDGDLQHTPNDLINLIKEFNHNKHDIVIGSRNMISSKKVNLNPLRFYISNLLNMVTNRLFELDLKDPMSGFIIIKKKIFLNSKRKLFLRGYKILLDIILSSRKQLKIKEVFINFKSRDKGFSKMRLKILLQLIIFMIVKFFTKIK